jgi:hypothetical protein
MLEAWVAYPLVVLVLACGAGALVQAAAGRELAAAVRMPCGLAVVIVAMDLLTRTTATARLAVAAVAALGVAGLALSAGPSLRHRRGWRGVRVRPPGPGAVAALVVFAAYAAPVVLSGEATWLGYAKLNDTSIWLGIVDQALAHGRTIADLQPSSYSLLLSGYLTVGYPIGSFLPLGLGHLVGQDIAWLVDPWMALVAAMLALALYGVARRAMPDRSSPWLATIVAVAAAQSTLLYGYYLWGSIKEVVGALLIATAALTAPLALEGERRIRVALPMALVVWALLAALSPGGLVWIGPGGLLAVALLGVRGRVRWPGGAHASGGVHASAGVSVGGALPTFSRVWPALLAGGLALGLGLLLLLRDGGFVQTFSGVLTGGSALGNLLRPLNPLQLAGIWPAGDFRVDPPQLAITYVLIAVVLIGATVGFVLALRAGRLEPVLYVLFAIAGALLTVVLASPWVGAKALASASPALPFAALGAGATLLSRQAVLGTIAIVLVAGGILWSNVIAYHDVSLAPRTLLSSLASVAPAVAGEGPTLVTDDSTFADYHFLRAGAPDSPTGQRAHPDLMLGGKQVPSKTYTDLDELELQDTLQYRTIVLQRSPVDTRPAEPYSLVRSNRYWQVWRRPASIAPQILSYLPIGDTSSQLRPAGVPSCAEVRRLAHVPGVSELVAAPTQNPITVSAATGAHPARWDYGSALAMITSGTARIPIEVPAAGRYEVWIAGTIQNPTSLSIDGRRIGSVADNIEEAGQYILFGEVSLSAGRHLATLHHDDDTLAPGSGLPDVAATLALSTDAPTPLPITVPASDASALCGRSLSWVDALG